MRSSHCPTAYSSSIAAALLPTAGPLRRTSRRSVTSWAGCMTQSVPSSGAPRRRQRMSADIEGTLPIRRGATSMLRSLILPVFAVLVAALVGAALLAALGQDPVAVYGMLITGSLVGWPNLSV